LGVVTTSIYKSVAESRVNKIDINGKSLVTPCYFPAVSSCITTYSTGDLIKFLGQHSRPLLTSAYDLYMESLSGIPIEKQLGELSKSWWGPSAPSASGNLSVTTGAENLETHRQTTASGTRLRPIPDTPGG